MTKGSLEHRLSIQAEDRNTETSGASGSTGIGERLNTKHPWFWFQGEAFLVKRVKEQ